MEMSKEMVNRIGGGILLLVFVVLAIALVANTADNMPVMAKQTIPGGNPMDAPEAISRYGCGTCHHIPGVVGADGVVGPELENISRRSLLAGQIPNTPDNLMLWIQHPQLVRPGSDMPEMGVSDTDARNIAAYLYSLPEARFTDFGQ
jgi:cytochrome c